MAKAKKTGEGGRRSETVSVRLDPRLKYLAEIAARRQRRTLSGFVEWAVEKSLDSVDLSHDEHSLSVAEAARGFHLWDVDEAERVSNLAFNFPDLLTFEEQLVWRLVRDCGYVWKGHYDKENKWVWTTRAENLSRGRLREHWLTFKKVAAHELPESALPTWNKTTAVKAVAAPDDDIPF